MKNSAENARRWLREAENTLRQARHAVEQKEYSLACFLAEQTSQKALKAVLFWDGARLVAIHSIAELLKNNSLIHKEFSKIIDQGGRLDQYYLSSRYPDAVPEPSIPSELFGKDQADEAVVIATTIFDFSRAIIK